MCITFLGLIIFALLFEKVFNGNPFNNGDLFKDIIISCNLP